MNMESGIGADADYAEYDEGAARKRRRLIVGIAVAAVLVLALIFFLNSRKKSAPAAESSLQRVTVTVPGRSQISASITAPGTIGARHDMPVGVVGEGGIVRQVLVNPGDWVAAGQTLAVIDRSVQTQQAASAAAQVNVARADAALAQSNLDRAKALVKNGFISKADIDTKTAARDQANARVRVAQAQLGEQNARNARLVVRAPAAGLVLTRTVEPGQIVGGVGTLFRIAEKGNMEMLARVAEGDLAKLRIGMPAAVVPIGSGAGVKGEVWQLSPVIDPNTRQGVVRIALSYDKALRPGGFANASFSAGKQDVPQLPESAVLSDSAGNYVLVIDKNDTVQRRTVKVGDVSDQGVSIAGGLDGTERVVMSAGSFLNAGEKVLPVLERPTSGAAG